ncbi:MAG: malto-oligosyltrehalose trehalohydrolase [Acidimicrobiia bacterium]
MRPWVWAPRARQVEIVVDPEGAAERCAAEPDGSGRFLSSADLEHGDLYGWSVDGGAVRADPRSMYQPSGPLGPSMIIDHDRFEWAARPHRPLVLDGAVLYEIHIGTFTAEGTFLSAIEKLEHLLYLGVTALELMPVAEQSFAFGWGYDPVNLFAPHHRYGTPQDLKRLVDAAHGLGLGVVVDVVYNHFGPEHCSLFEFGDYTSSRHSTPWGDAVNLDGPGSAEVRSFIVDNCAMWLRDYRADGLRLDATHALHDESRPHILQEMSALAARLGDDAGNKVALIAEDDRHDPELTTPLRQSGMGLDSQWADDLHHAVHVALTGEQFGYYAAFDGGSQIPIALEHGFVRWPPGCDRDLSATEYPSRFVVCLQNHDQIGNRAVGERIAQLVGFDAAAAAAAIALLNPFVTLLFQGEDWAASTPFAYFADPTSDELRDAISTGRRAEFPWWSGDVVDPVDLATFRSSVLDWSEARSGRHLEMVEWYRSLIALKIATCNQRGVDSSATYDNSVVRWRFGPNEVAVNLSDEARDIERPSHARSLILARGASVSTHRIALGTWGVAVVR